MNALPNAITKDQLLAKLGEVAAALGAGWRAVAGEGWRDHTLVHTSGATVAAAPDTSSTSMSYGFTAGMEDRICYYSRVHFDAVFPHPLRAPYSRTSGPLRIGVAASKPAAQIARDLARRLLPVYLPAFARACEVRAEEERAERDVRAFGAEVTRAFPFEPEHFDERHGDRDEVKLRAPYIVPEVEIDARAGNAEVRVKWQVEAGDPAALAAQVKEILARVGFPVRDEKIDAIDTLKCRALWWKARRQHAAGEPVGVYSEPLPPAPGSDADSPRRTLEVVFFEPADGDATHVLYTWDRRDPHPDSAPAATLDEGIAIARAAVAEQDERHAARLAADAAEEDGLECLHEERDATTCAGACIHYPHGSGQRCGNCNAWEDD